MTLRDSTDNDYISISLWYSTDNDNISIILWDSTDNKSYLYNNYQ
jgi:hypothetical protein